MRKVMPKITALLLCVLLLIGMLPANALADESGTAAENGEAAYYQPVEMKIPFNAVGTYALTELDGNDNPKGDPQVFNVPDDGTAIVLTFTEPEQHKYSLQRTDGDGRNNQTYIVEVIIVDDETSQENLSLTMVIYPKGKQGEENKVPGIVNAEITLKKLGDEDAALSGATFMLYGQDAVTYNSEGKPQLNDGAAPLIDTPFTTGADGTVLLGDLQPGTYFLKETQAPHLYQPLDDLITIEVGIEGIDESMKPTVEVSPAEITNVKVEDEDSTRKFVVSIDNEYDDVSFVFNKLGETQTVDETSKTITIATDQKFAGATFALYAAENFNVQTWQPAGDPVDTKVSDENGIVNFGKIPYGTYYMVETAKGSGHDEYWDNDAVYQVVVALPEQADGEPTVTITVAKAATGTASDAGTGMLSEDDILNQLISYRVRLLKQDQDSKLPIQNAVFALYTKDALDESGNVIEGALALKTITTDAEGKADLGRLTLGEYWLIETSAPDPYTELDQPIALAVTANGVTSTIDGKASELATIAQTQDATGTAVAHDVTLTVLDPCGVDVVLEVEKLLNSYSTKEYTFSYELSMTGIADTVSDVAENEALLNKTLETIQIKVNGNQTSGSGKNTGSFRAVTLYGSGTYTFRIKEVAPNPMPDGWTYDANLEKTATVSVAWNAQTQKMEATVAYSDPVSESNVNYEKFTNSYEANGSWTPSASKTLSGRPIVAGEFTFTVKEGNNTVSTGTVNADGTISFTPISYTLADVGTHNYAITEDAGSAAGVTYASNTVTVAVVVSDNDDGTLTAAPQYTGDATFVNTFNATGTWTPNVFKTLNGRDMKEGETYTVTVKDAAGVTKMTGTVTAGKNGEPKAFEFTPATIGYTQADVADFAPTTFTYTITETAGSAGGVTYDETVHTVNVTVALHQNDDGTYSNALDVTDNAQNGKGFTNTYAANPVPVVPAVEKKISGEKTVQDMTFIFTLTADSVVDEGSYFNYDPEAESNSAIENGNSVSKSVEVPAGTTTAVRNAFDTITFTKTGTYTFTIEEDKTDPISHVTYDNAKWTLQVVVTDDLNGNLVATATYLKDGKETAEAAAGFDNTYTPTPVTQVMEAEKRLTGDTLHDAKNTVFTFTLSYLSGPRSVFRLTTDEQGTETRTEISAAEGGTVVNQIEIKGSDVEAAGSASAAFDNIEFTREGTYTFKIIEEKGNTPKVDYDDTVWNAIVEVKDNNGTLEATLQYLNKKTGATDSTIAVFTNKYTPDETSYGPYVYKKVEGEPRPDSIRSSEKFNFQLTMISGDPNKAGASIPTGGDAASCYEGGTAEFGQITFTRKGTYVFQIVEVEGDHPEYFRYDTSPWTLTVTITDNDKGELVVESYSYKRGDETYSYPTSGDAAQSEENTTPISAVVTNTYEPLPASLKIPAKKLMSADSDELEVPAEFTFTLRATAEETEDGLGKGSYTVIDEVKTVIPVGESWSKEIALRVPAKATESPVVNFEEISYSKAGIYTYTVSEVGGTIDGMTYSTEEKTITVTVTDVGGKLEAAWTVDDAAAESVDLTNTYKIPTVDVEVLKVWDDQDDQDGIRPKTIKVTLNAAYTNATGEVSYTVGDPKELSADSEWSYIWKGLPALRELTCPVTYSVEEAAIEYQDADGNPASAPEGFDKGYELVSIVASATPASGAADDGAAQADDAAATDDGAAQTDDAAAADAETDAAEASTQTGVTVNASVESCVFTITNKHVPETMNFEFNKVGEVAATTDVSAAANSTEEETTEENTDTTAADNATVGGEITVTMDDMTYTIQTEAFEGAVFELSQEPGEEGGQPVSMTATSEGGVVKFERVHYGTYTLKEINKGTGHDEYWDNDAVYTVTLTAPETEGSKPTVKIELAQAASGTDDGVGTGILIEDEQGYTIVNMLISYRINLVKQDEKTKTALDGAEFLLYDKKSVVLDEDGKVPENAKALLTVTTANGGKADLGRMLPGEYYLVEKTAPQTEKKHCEYRAIEDPILLSVTTSGITVTMNGEQSAMAAISQPTEQHTADLTVLNRAYGDLVIVKTLSTTGPDSASFVFRIEWLDQIRYATIAINAGEDKGTYTMKKAIPVGTDVKVTEVSTGLQFTHTTEEDDNGNTIPIALVNADSAATFNITNDHTGTGGGNAVVNRFQAEETDGTWTLTKPEQLPDSNEKPAVTE